MRLSELMSSLDLSVYPTIGIVVFFGVFVLVGARALRTSRRELDHNASLALEEDRALLAGKGGSESEGGLSS